LNTDLTIAGSGPSAKEYGRVDIATKKGTCPSDYVAAKHSFFWTRWPRAGDEKMMVWERNCDCGKCRDCKAPIEWQSDHKDDWENYFLSFDPKQMNSAGVRKASLGTLAVFMAVERWRPQTIGLIGYDWILDGNPGWYHDAEKERMAILSLVNIVDLRNDEFIRRVRPEGSGCIPHFLSECD
jgi:hypothetical protein